MKESRRAPFEWCDTLHGGTYVCIVYIYIYIYFSNMFCNLLGMNDKGKKGWYVTLCGWSAKQTIPLSVLERNQTKA